MIDGGTTEKAATKTTSEALTALWDRNWNVVIAESPNFVLPYGFAHNSHWYFHNNYKGSARSFVVWKDYNGENMVNFGLGDAATQSSVGFEDLLISKTQTWFTQNAIPMNEFSHWEMNKAIVERLETTMDLGVTFSGVGTRALSVSKFGAHFATGGSGEWIYTSFQLRVEVNFTEGYFTIHMLAFVTRNGNYRNNT